MTIQSQILTFIPREYEIFAGLDVDKHSIAATFTDHSRLMQALRLPYSSEQLLNYVRKHFPGQRLAFVYEAGPTGFGLYDGARLARVNDLRGCLSSLVAIPSGDIEPQIVEPRFG